MSIAINGTTGITTPATASGGTTAVAWVNFGYISSAMVIRASYNVNSVTRNSAGNYTINFTTALVDANYAVVATSSRNYSVTGNMSITSLNSGNNAQTQTASAFTILTQDQAANFNDVSTANCVVFR